MPTESVTEADLTENRIDEKISSSMIRDAEWISGIELTEADREQVASDLAGTMNMIDTMRAHSVGYDEGSCLSFNAAPWLPPGTSEIRRNLIKLAPTKCDLPESDEEIAFLPVFEQAELIRSKQLSSLRLTRIYLARLKKFDPLLNCTVTFLEDHALQQARTADEEIANGDYRGPLHGIPWGVKDLMAFPGQPTTWGATPFKDQTLDTTATVINHLDEAGAVLVAKLSTGALAQDDKWMGKQTRNPWNPDEGSSGSSAGPASAVVAGLVGFAIGTETCGSIVSPCTSSRAKAMRTRPDSKTRFGGSVGEE